MAEAISLDVEIPPDLSDQLDEVAEASRRERSDLVVEALRSLVPSELGTLDAIRKGIRQADADEIIEHDSLVARLAARAASQA
jgi:predicted transcriptional regulator